MAGLDLSAADAAGPARQLLAAPRVMGVGAGIFILGLFLVVSVVVCIFGSRTRKPGLVFAASVLLYGVVVAVLLGSPKGYRAPPALKGYDRSIVPMALMGALLCVGVGLSAAGVFLFHVRAAMYARPLSYHADVLGQR